MSITFYDLVGKTSDMRFSPACWRTRMALEHKGLDYEAVPTLFTQIPSIAGGGQRTLPVLDDNGTVVRDSFGIARYLEETYPDRPSLFGGEGGVAVSQFMHWWTGAVVDGQIARMVLVDIYNSIDDEDKDYFRTSREKRFGKALEEVQDQSDAKLADFRESLLPLRLTIKKQAFIGGDQPVYADYCVFGSLQWARLCSPLALLEEEDPVAQWFERCLDLYDGMGRKAKG